MQFLAWQVIGNAVIKYLLSKYYAVTKVLRSTYCGIIFSNYAYLKDLYKTLKGIYIGVKNFTDFAKLHGRLHKKTLNFPKFPCNCSSEKINFSLISEERY